MILIITINDKNNNNSKRRRTEKRSRETRLGLLNQMASLKLTSYIDSLIRTMNRLKGLKFKPD